ncbi:MAG: hypothetical protein B7Y98_00785 [Sphingomonas sp. 32-62-10]|nr:MAG: hypothetical protein B7Z43_06700 [Sphingomonas sp. 12-62-6]OYX40643.1 MAG: hypothetical protein B7Y98_00785 [Sphingomonas sp. 32-62-10]
MQSPICIVERRVRTRLTAPIDLCQETVRMWRNRFGRMFAGDIRRRRIGRMRGCAIGTWMR